MALVPTTSVRPTAPGRATSDPAWLRRVAIAAVLLFVAAFLVLPLVIVFKEAFARGVPAFVASFNDPATAHAVRLTLVVAAIAVPLNIVFGLCAAWALTRFRFPGRDLLTTLIELPLWVSPVIGGLVFVLLFGAQGWWGEWLREHDIRILFALPGLVLGTVFVTFPFVARVLIPLMQAQGTAEEEAALTLGARGWQVFTRVTLPRVRWALLYGAILCNARAMGEFGAVSVLSGNVKLQTNTLPLHIEVLHGEFKIQAAFACASLLTLLAVATLVLKTWAEWRQDRLHTPQPPA
jgi:sulfate transport system permease protein